VRLSVQLTTRSGAVVIVSEPAPETAFGVGADAGAIRGRRVARNWTTHKIMKIIVIITDLFSKYRY